MSYTEISGVCPSCGHLEHFGRKQGRQMDYLCRACWTAFTREEDVLISTSDLERSQNITIEGLQKITKILRKARQELSASLKDKGLPDDV